jgi:NEDD8-activating enzyme E1
LGGVFFIDRCIIIFSNPPTHSQEEHMDWVHARALARATAHGIPAFPRATTAGVAKRIVPAIASTNAIVAAACSLEALKAATMLAPGLNNYALYTGGDGVYAATQAHARDAACAVCSPGVPLTAPAATTLGDWLESVRSEPGLTALARGGATTNGAEDGAPPRLAAPTVATADGAVLAGGGVYAADTAANRDKALGDLLGGGGPHALVLNDRLLPAPVRVRLSLV